jgi:cbb3-type cytochrome oxidase subunit 3
MILKLLLTLAIVIAVIIWFRSQNTKRLDSNNAATGNLLTQDAAQNTWIKPFSYGIAGLIIAAGILVVYLSWQEDNTQYQVTITNPQTGTSETFIALKKNMRGRLFITQSGREIRVSDLERIEVKKLATPSH